jgi:hypothetical protein
MDAIATSEIQACATAHALAELWATLTALPIEPRVSATQVGALITRLTSDLEVIELELPDYQTAMSRCVDRGRRSGALFDALHLVAAERVRADLLLTFNVRHFVALARDGSPRILAPPDPPGLVHA